MSKGKLGHSGAANTNKVATAPVKDINNFLYGSGGLTTSAAAVNGKRRRSEMKQRAAARAAERRQQQHRSARDLHGIHRGLSQRIHALSPTRQDLVQALVQRRRHR